MTQVTREHTTFSGDASLLTCEASTLGLRPGDWPDRLETTLGNRRPFLLFKRQCDADHETLWVDYLQALSELTLRVYND